jgi:4-amino-4-deoxy-L-arabinose transferase-like glycosyltransferase
MVSRFNPGQGYDFISHWKYIDWFRLSHTLPAPDFSRETYHEPLYYVAMAALRALGVTRIGSFSVAAGCARLLLLAAGLVAMFPRQRLVRCVALAVAAVLPASIHLDGMINPEAWLGLFSAGLMVCAWRGLETEGRAAFGWWILAGICASLGILTKISIITIIAAVGTAVAIATLRSREAWRARLSRLVPVGVALAIVIGASGWYFARNVRLYGKPILSSYDYTEKHAVAAFANVPLWQRRSLGYVAGWTLDIYRRPTWPAGYQPVPRFFPVLVASTFADYYRYAFAPAAPPGTWVHELEMMPTRTAWELAKIAIAAGTLIAAITVAAWLGALAMVWQRRSAGQLMLLFVPLFTLAGQLWYAWKYPADLEGPVKGVYMQFAAPPLCALFGVGVAWLWARRSCRPLAALSLAAVVMVALYSSYCRFASPVVSPW